MEMKRRICVHENQGAHKGRSIWHACMRPHEGRGRAAGTHDAQVRSVACVGKERVRLHARGEACQGCARYVGSRVPRCATPGKYPRLRLEYSHKVGKLRFRSQKCCEHSGNRTKRSQTALSITKDDAIAKTAERYRTYLHVHIMHQNTNPTCVSSRLRERT